MKSRKTGGNLLIPAIAIGIGVVVGVVGMAINYRKRQTRRSAKPRRTPPWMPRAPRDNNGNLIEEHGVRDVNNR